MKVVITIGVPGCGKSTWAQNYSTHNPNVVIVERDIIREVLCPGYFTQKPNKSFEEKVTQEQRNLLRQALLSETVQTVIISDTNLKKSRLVLLEKFILEVNPEATIERKIFWESLDFLLCAQRNRNRTKVVPEDVLASFWKRFKCQYGNTQTLPDISAHKQLVFVGDIHAQYDHLQSLIDDTDLDREFLVFLGDINDSRTTTGNYLKVYQLIRTLVDKSQAELIHSNHQKNLINAIRGKRKSTGWGLKSTLDEMWNAGLITPEYEKDPQTQREKLISITSSSEALDMAMWLDCRPYYFERYLQRNAVDIDHVVGVHAQYLPQYLVNPYDISGKGLEALVYGTKAKSNEHQDEVRDRYLWWKEYENLDTFVVSGHYHQFSINKYCAVIDSGCGQGGPLTAFNYDKPSVKMYGVP